MRKNEKTKILKGLTNIPQGARILQVSTSASWLIYVEFSPSHCYYITVDREK